MRQITENSYEYNIQIVILFIDFNHAFDSIYRHTMRKNITTTRNTQ